MKKLLLALCVFILASSASFATLFILDGDNGGEILYDDTVKANDKAMLSSIFDGNAATLKHDAKIYIVEKRSATCLKNSLLYEKIEYNDESIYRYIVIGSEDPAESLAILHPYFSQYDEKNCDQ